MPTKTGTTNIVRPTTQVRSHHNHIRIYPDCQHHIRPTPPFTNHCTHISQTNNKTWGEITSIRFRSHPREAVYRTPTHITLTQLFSYTASTRHCKAPQIHLSFNTPFASVSTGHQQTCTTTTQPPYNTAITHIKPCIIHTFTNNGEHITCMSFHDTNCLRQPLRET